MLSGAKATWPQCGARLAAALLAAAALQAASAQAQAAPAPRPPSGGADMSGPGDLQAVTKAVLSADDRRRAANVAGDVGALEAMFTPEFTYTHFNGLREGREPYLARIRASQVRYLSIDRLAASVRVYGDVALVDGLAAMTYRAPADPAPSTIKSLYLAVWVFAHGEWRMTSYASTLAPRE